VASNKILIWALVDKNTIKVKTDNIFFINKFAIKKGSEVTDFQGNDKEIF
jgi:hypothetical protein